MRAMADDCTYAGINTGSRNGFDKLCSNLGGGAVHFMCVYGTKYDVSITTSFLDFLNSMP